MDDVGLIKETLLRACTTNPCVSKISKNICRMDDNNARYDRCRLMPMYCVLHQHGQSHKESKMLKNVVKQKIMRPRGKRCYCIDPKHRSDSKVYCQDVRGLQRGQSGGVGKCIANKPIQSTDMIGTSVASTHLKTTKGPAYDDESGTTN